MIQTTEHYTAEAKEKARESALERMVTRNKVGDPGSVPPITPLWVNRRYVRGLRRVLGPRHPGMLIFAVAFAALGALSLAWAFASGSPRMDWVPVLSVTFMSGLLGAWTSEAPKRMKILEKARSKASPEAQTRFLYRRRQKRGVAYLVFSISMVTTLVMAYALYRGAGLLAASGVLFLGFSLGTLGVFLMFRLLSCRFCQGYTLFFRYSGVWTCSRCESDYDEG